MRVSRRGVLAGGALGGGLLVAWALLPRSYSDPLPAEEGETAFGAWLKIGADGVVTVAVPQLEMGQGVTTLLPQIIARELGADWRQVAVEPAPASGAYANLPLAAEWAPLRRRMVPWLDAEPDDLLLKRWAQDEAFTATADGTTLAAYEMPCREAAATARAMLAMAAAELWDVDWQECEVLNGLVTNGERQAGFGALAISAAEQDPPDTPPLRPEEIAELAGSFPMPEGAQTDYPRVDLPSKVDGTYQFAGDIRLPEMVHAAIRHGPVDRAEISSLDVPATRGIRGLRGIVKGKRWLAAAADNWWAAEQALDAMAPRFRTANPVNSQRMNEALDNAVRRGERHRVAERGNGDAGLDKPTLALRYDVMPALHAPLETASATARLRDGKLELWMAAQAPEQARQAAAKALGMALEDVILYPVAAGGSFDRRLEHDHAIEVALIARELDRPVQLTWSRWQEHLLTRPRPPVAGVLAARIDAEGRIGTFRARLAAPSSSYEFGRRLFGNLTSWAAMEDAEGRPDAMVCQGAMPPYAIPNAAVDHAPARIGLPTGRMRGKADGYTCFMVESFIDEVAQRYAQEPLAYRISMLGEDVRLAECLQRAARLAGWGGGGDRSGEGIACHRMGNPATGGRIAVVATAAIGEGGVRVTRLSAAVDIGRVVNRDLALQQVEGGLVYGLGLALGSATEYQDGLPTQARLGDLGLPTMADMPEVRVELVESESQPFDPGEIGVPAVAPAIANAIYSATGLRLRRLPLLSGGL
ncbi:xanthine dehydrogenase family protein molybdopterin-binding subunit [Paraurantiacibacter namhicola]|uniref:xanthine dehydrogenase family protein molybdopterin-binding subunit n=1 Tax=Paraurantiacibacter namhicola TaxID=645517 RepID=UPI00082DF54F|nr:molybdopterin cofactor-binding domain-containing protein [Paraurantiacibacter namhicola]